MPYKNYIKNKDDIEGLVSCCFITLSLSLCLPIIDKITLMLAKQAKKYYNAKITMTIIATASGFIKYV